MKNITYLTLNVLLWVLVSIAVAFCSRDVKTGGLVVGEPIAVWMWSADSTNLYQKKLDSGEAFSLERATQQGVNLYVIWEGQRIFLNQYDDRLLEHGRLEIYTHDFDDNGRDEIVVVAGEVVQWLVSIYEYSGGLLKHCGEIEALNEPIHIQRNEMWTPIGSQGLGELYIYNSCEFYTLEPIN